MLVARAEAGQAATREIRAGFAQNRARSRPSRGKYRSRTAPPRSTSPRAGRDGSWAAAVRADKHCIPDGPDGHSAPPDLCAARAVLRRVQRVAAARARDAASDQQLGDERTARTIFGGCVDLKQRWSGAQPGGHLEPGRGGLAVGLSK